MKIYKLSAARVSGALTVIVMTIVHFLLDAPVGVFTFGYYQLATTAPQSVEYVQWNMLFRFFLALTGFGTLPSFWIYLVRIPQFRSRLLCRSVEERGISAASSKATD